MSNGMFNNFSTCKDEVFSLIMIFDFERTQINIQNMIKTNTNPNKHC